MIQVDVDFREALAALKALPAEVADKKGGGVLRPALREAAKVIQQEAKTLAPVDSGVLRDAINVLVEPNPTDVTERAVVKVTSAKKVTTLEGRSKPYWWMFHEFGTEKMAARPFLRPAFDARAGAALQAFKDRLVKGIKRAARKIAKGQRSG